MTQQGERQGDHPHDEAGDRRPRRAEPERDQGDRRKDREEYRQFRLDEDGEGEDGEAGEEADDLGPRAAEIAVLGEPRGEQDAGQHHRQAKPAGDQPVAPGL